MEEKTKVAVTPDSIDFKEVIRDSTSHILKILCIINDRLKKWVISPAVVVSAGSVCSHSIRVNPQTL